MKTSKLNLKRFIIRKSLIGKNIEVTFVNAKKQTCVYNHDKVYEHFKNKFENMPCFHKYKYYTNSQNVPKFVRDAKLCSIK
jgi:hypothetical protein